MPNITIEDGVDGGIIYDSWLNSADPNGPKGASPLLAMHELTPPQRIHELIYVSLVNYAGVTWINGKFILTPVATGGDVPYNVEFYRLKRAWTENTVTWNNADTPWQVPGGSGANDKAAIPECTIAVDNVVTEFTVTADTLNAYWSGDTDNQGALFYPIETGGYVHFGSSENAGNEPTFYGEYEGFDGFAYMVDVAASSPDFSSTAMTTPKLSSVTMVQ